VKASKRLRLSLGTLMRVIMLSLISHLCRSRPIRRWWRFLPHGAVALHTCSAPKAIWSKWGHPSSSLPKVGSKTPEQLLVSSVEKPSRGREVPPEPTQVRTRQVLPAVRALAHKLDVDLNLVQATGPAGTITRGDVERAAKSLVDAGPAEPLRGMRRAMAQR